MAKKVDVGGVKCNCCNFGTVKQTRILLNRMDRRKTKNALKAEAKRYETD